MKFPNIFGPSVLLLPYCLIVPLSHYFSSSPPTSGLSSHFCTVLLTHYTTASLSPWITTGIPLPQRFIIPLAHCPIFPPSCCPLPHVLTASLSVAPFHYGPTTALHHCTSASVPQSLIPSLAHCLTALLPKLAPHCLTVKYLPSIHRLNLE